MQSRALQEGGALRQLDFATARRVQSAQRISSFDSLIASLVLSSIHSSATSVTVNVAPHKLDVTVVDNGASIRSQAWDSIGCVPIQHPRSSILHTAATFSTLHIFSSSSSPSTKNRHRLKRIRTGNIIEDSSLSARPDLLHPHRGGVVIDIRHLFVNLPVRRNAALQMTQARLLHPLRSRIMAIALCNPNVSIRVNLLPGNEPFFESRARSVLKRESLSRALALRSNPTYLPVRAREDSTSVSVSGFIAANALARSSSDAQIVAVNGVPLEHTARVHTLIRNASRSYVQDTSRGRVPFPLPAYVLNIKCKSDALSVSAYEVGACIVGFRGLDVEKFVADQVSIAINSGNEEATIIASPNAENPSPDPVEEGNFQSLKEEFGAYLKETGDIAMGLKEETNADLSTPLNMRDALLQHTKKRRRANALDPICACPTRRPFSALEMRKNGYAGTLPYSALGRRPNSIQGARQFPAARRLHRPQSAAAVMEGIAKTLPNWKNPCFQASGRAPRAIMAARPGAPARPYSSDIQTVNVRRETLDKMRVIGQVDRKFIITIDALGTLYAVDQHAASERAHFERLIDEARMRKSVRLHKPISVTLSAAQNALLEVHWRAVERWGWRLAKLGNAYTIRILAVPAVVSADVRLDSAEDLLNHLGSLSDGEQVVPKPLVNSLASVACHGAVRFGDALTHSQCASLLSGMAQCDSPFTCAHGRPSIVPLAVLTSTTRY